jgi:hypothetical protein
MTDQPHHDAEEILMAFAVEPEHDRGTLERYLRLHPELAADLIDLSMELRLQRATADISAPVDEAWVEASLADFHAAAPTRAAAQAADPFAAVAADELVTLRRSLDVPSSVIQGFRSRAVDIATVPAGFLADLARGLRTGVDELSAFLAGPPRLTPGLSYKSDDAPSADGGKVTFQALLEQCRVPEDRRRQLLNPRD